MNYSFSSYYPYIIIYACLSSRNISKITVVKFITEISYITGKTASADEVVKEKLSYMIWDRETLDNLRKTKPAIMDKLDRILTLDMADKLTK